MHARTVKRERGAALLLRSAHARAWLVRAAAAAPVRVLGDSGLVLLDGAGDAPPLAFRAFDPPPPVAAAAAVWLSSLVRKWMRFFV